MAKLTFEDLILKKKFFKFNKDEKIEHSEGAISVYTDFIRFKYGLEKRLSRN